MVVLMIYATAKYGFKFDYNYENWFYFYMAGTLLFYALLDNADGKQARKTKNSTSLGLLLDHGCDAFTCAFFGINSIQVFGLDNFRGLMVVVIVCFGFYLKTYEQFFKKESHWVYELRHDQSSR